jgi:hypothetical protein
MTPARRTPASRLSAVAHAELGAECAQRSGFGPIPDHIELDLVWQLRERTEQYDGVLLRIQPTDEQEARWRGANGCLRREARNVHRHWRDGDWCG